MNQPDTLDRSPLAVAMERERGRVIEILLGDPRVDKQLASSVRSTGGSTDQWTIGDDGEEVRMRKKRASDCEDKLHDKCKKATDDLILMQYQGQICISSFIVSALNQVFNSPFLD